MLRPSRLPPPQELIPPFAHNPTIRKMPDGSYVIWFIGGWSMTPAHCKASADGQRADHYHGRAPPGAAPAGGPTNASCVNGTKLDPPGMVREGGGDYKLVTLAAGATIEDCAASCCGDPKCVAFSYNTCSPAGSCPPVCKHKSDPGQLVQNGCPLIGGQHSCLSGMVPPKPPACDGQDWPKSCGPDMPGPMSDCCGPCHNTFDANCGCGISMAHSASGSLSGPWDVTPLTIENQWESDDVYCTHTNPSPYLLGNGSIVMAFNAGYCNKHLETIGLAVSHGGWKGPWNLLVKNSVLKNPDGSPHKCEDPFVWKSSRGWHLLVHNQQSPQGESAYGYSVDGLNWTLSPTTPYDCVLRFTDGSSATASGCGNRPQIVFADDGTPQLIVNGAFAANPLGGSNTYTLFRKIKQP